MNQSSHYVLRWRGRQSGPFSLAEINRKLDEHEIGMGHEIQCDDQWMSIEAFLARPNGVVDPSATPAAGPENVSPPGPQRPRPSSAPASFATAVRSAVPARVFSSAHAKRRLVYALLGILFGFAGVHNYYARHWMTGLLQLLLSVASLLLGFGIIVPWLWAMVESFVVRRDGNGLEML